MSKAERRVEDLLCACMFAGAAWIMGMMAMDSLFPLWLRVFPGLSAALFVLVAVGRLGFAWIGREEVGSND